MKLWEKLDGYAIQYALKMKNASPLSYQTCVTSTLVSSGKSSIHRMVLKNGTLQTRVDHMPFRLKVQVINCKNATKNSLTGMVLTQDPSQMA
jgi:hypothetical protein